MAGWQKNDIPRIRCFSLGDFHDFDHCPFRFFVNHHLEKKYELAEGSENLALGSILDMAIKKVHNAKAYFITPDQLSSFVKAAENAIRDQAEYEGPRSFYGPITPFLTERLVRNAQKIFQDYYGGIGGKFKTALHKNKLKPFWKATIPALEPLVLWGGADGVEMGDDGMPEVVDYKLVDNEATDRLDMDLMPKVYIYLCANELKELGFTKARFKIRLWNDPQNESFYEEFDLKDMPNLEMFFKDKIERILRTTYVSFCEKDWCKVCKNPKREEWLSELQIKGWISPQAQMVEDAWLEGEPSSNVAPEVLLQAPLTIRSD